MSVKRHPTEGVDFFLRSDGTHVCAACKAEYKGLRDVVDCVWKHTKFSPYPANPANTTDSAVNPDYYKGRDVMDIANRYNLTRCEFQVVKYVLRGKNKNGLEDLKKALWYLEEEIRIVGSRPVSKEQ